MGYSKVEKRNVRTIDAKEVGLGMPAEETFNRPNEYWVAFQRDSGKHEFEAFFASVRVWMRISSAAWS